MLKNRPLKLVLLLQDLEFGGTQRYALNLLSHLNRDLFSAELWTLRGGKDMLPLAEAAKIKTVHLTEMSWVGPRALFTLWSRLLRSRPDILYTLTVLPNTWGRLLGYLSWIPVVVSSFRNRVAFQYEKRLWPLSAKIICNAESLKYMIAQEFSVPLDRIVVIQNGVDTDAFCPDPDSTHTEPLVVFAGRLVEQKDPLTLLAAFRSVLRRIPEAKLIMLGEGHLRSKLEEFIQNNGLSGRVSIMNGTRDISAYFRRARVFTLPSLYEGSPNAMIEAMAAGVPIVATRVDGIPEIVREGDSGLLVPPQNPEALAEALCTLLSDETAARKMGMNARQKALLEHSLTHAVRLTEQVFLDCASEAGLL